MKEFGKVMQYMEFHEKDFEAANPDLRLSFNQMGGVLTTLGFIHKELLPVHADFSLVQDLWDLLGGIEMVKEAAEGEEAE